jgi:GT2 family glycosyltransferase
MKLSVIIINFNTFQLSCNCIDSVYEKLKDVEFEIILVDNSSTECDPNLFKSKFPQINLVISNTNTGFAGGNNLGLQYATGEYILLLNSDTELINNAPKICLDHLEENENAGLVTCQLSYPNGKIQHNCRRFRTIGWELLEFFPLYKLMLKPKREQLMLHSYFDHQSFSSCDWVWGTFMLFPKSIISQFPKKKLSTDFFMYCEDVLWCWEIKQLGYQIHFLPSAKVMHIHKASTSQSKLNELRLTSIKNHANFMRKIYPDWRWYIFVGIFYSKQYIAVLVGKILK